jgi:hypothetical protein
MNRPKAKHVVLVAVVVLFAAQLIPISHTNPPVDPSRSFYATEPVPADLHATFENSCKDCHSNRTVWPWYSYIAPVSWMVADDVRGGRRHLNFDEWNTYTPAKKEKRMEDICEQVTNGDMPDSKYLVIHRHARLTQSERESVCDWVGSVR